MTQNQIAWHNAQELRRHNEETERENQRHSKMEEALKARSNELSHESNIIAKEHYERMDAINAQHYANQDLQAKYSLMETQRANVASEQLKAQQNAINASAIAETVRHQKAVEAIDARLASNTIWKTAAEVSEKSANASLLHEKIRESQAAQRLTNAQTLKVGAETATEPFRRLVYSAEIGHYQAQDHLINAQTTETKTRSVKNIVDTTRSVVNIPLDVIKAGTGSIRDLGSGFSGIAKGAAVFAR